MKPMISCITTRAGMLWLLLLLTAFPLMGQLSLERQVLATSGAEMAGTSHIHSVTVGELAIQTREGSGLILTHGFQQPHALMGTPIESIRDSRHQLTVYPNPSSGRFWILLPAGQQEGGYILVTDLTGRPVAKKRKVPKGEALQRVQMDLSELPSGFYLISWTEGPHRRVANFQKGF